MPVKDSYPEGLSIVLPAFNEEENIETAIRRCFSVLQKLPVPSHEVVVVNDGSHDRTSAICHNLQTTWPQLEVIDFERNRGYGAALSAGFLHAKYRFVFYTDSDNQFDVSELRFLLPMMEDYDLVVGSRVYRYDPFIRLFLSWGYNMLVRFIFGVRVHDIDCAFKLFRRSMFDFMPIEATDFFVDTEIVVKAHRQGYRLNEVGVRHYPRMAGRTSVRPSDIPRTLRTLLRIWRSAHKVHPLETNVRHVELEKVTSD